MEVKPGQVGSMLALCWHFFRTFGASCVKSRCQGESVGKTTVLRGSEGQKIVPNWLLGLVLACVKPVLVYLGRSRARLERVLACLGPVWACLGPVLAWSWTCFGLSWTCLGPVWSLSGAYLRLFWGCLKPFGTFCWNCCSNLCGFHSLLFVSTLQRGGTCEAHGIGAMLAILATKNLCSSPFGPF